MQYLNESMNHDYELSLKKKYQLESDMGAIKESKGELEKQLESAEQQYNS